MEKKYVLSLDQGTTSSRAILFNKEGKNIATAQKEFQQIYPKAAWVEHDPKEIWSTQASIITEALLKANVEGKDIVAIGITNQRETTVVWDRHTGEPIYNAIVWQDRRTSQYCDTLKKDEGIRKKIQEKTGLIIDAYFSATKVKWILDHVSGAREKANKGDLLFGTIDTWLVWNLTGGKSHISDVTNASRTMLYNIHTLQWDEELLKLFDIPRSMLAEVKASSDFFGLTTGRILSYQVPITGIAGDQQAALFGQMCIHPGMVKNTYGTGCFMLMNVGEKAVISKNNLLTTIAWKIKDKVNYALEGSVFIGGALIQWLRDGLGILSSSSEVENLAKGVKDTDGLYIVPAFSGLGAPYWNQHARGMMVGITRGTTKSHLARASLESIAFQTTDVLRAMEKDSGISATQLRVDGGANLNDFLMQFQSDLLGKEIIRAKTVELTALGAAYLAGLSVNYWDSLDKIQAYWQKDKIFKPSSLGEKKDEMIRAWNRAIRAVCNWADDK